MTDGISLNLNCPSCGGTVESVEGQRATACPYCQSLLYIEGDRGVYTVMFANNLDVPRARGSLKKWFDEGFKARDLPEKAQITEVYPIYIPFWRLIGRAAGWVCGYKKETRRDSEGRTHTKKVYMEKMVFRDFEWSQIACDPGDIGVKRLPSGRGPVISHEEGQIPTFEATTSQDDARSQGSDAIGKMAESSANVPNVTFKRIHVLPKFLSLTFYPIWMCRYTYDGRTYFATLDGLSGESLSGRAPGDPLWQGLAMVGGATVGGLLTGISLTGMLSGLDVEVSGIGMIAGVVIFIAAFLFFRHGSEITEGDIERPYKKSIKDIVNLDV
jgi:hypothetical protein